MPQSVAAEKRSWPLVRIAIMVVLIVMYWGMGLYYHAVLRQSTVYPHAAYIPIVLAGLWWGRRGVLAAVLLAGLHFSFYLLGMGLSNLPADGARVLFFIAVGLCVGLLSERVRNEHRAVVFSEERYRFLIDKALTGIVVYADETVVFANHQFSEMLGYGLGDLEETHLWDLFAPDERDRVKALVQERDIRDGGDLHYEARLVSRDGRTIWADIASAVTVFDGRRSVLVNAYDISSRKQAEQDRAAMSALARQQEDQLVHSTRLAELGEMAAGIAHELNQPLTGIRNFARNAAYMLDQDAGTREDVAENLRLITEQVDRASRIINQMREMTRKASPLTEPLAIGAVISESIEFMAPQFRLSNVEVIADLAADLPPVAGDKVRLGQVFLNILANARHAMEEAAERRLTVRAFCEPGRPRPVVITIADTGAGFPEEDIARLFVPFYSTKGPGAGTGLGLSISLSIIKDHNGTIEAAGRPGRGATFTVRLPAAAPDPGLKEQG